MLDYLSIITPLSRSENLKYLSCNIPSRIEWIIVTDGKVDINISLTQNIKVVEGPNTKGWGDVQRSIGVKYASRKYIYFLDDDNLISSFLLSIALSSIEYYNSDGALFGIISHYPFIEDYWFPPDHILKGNVDIGMFIGKRSCILELEFEHSKYFPDFKGARGADFEFIKNYNNTFKIIKLPMILGFHNAIDLVKNNSKFTIENLSTEDQLLKFSHSYVKNKNPLNRGSKNA